MKTLTELEELLAPRGQKALAAAWRAQPTLATYPATVIALRKLFGDVLARLATEQTLLRQKAKVKFGEDAERMYFTQETLEMASHPTVSAYRPLRFISYRRIADLGCGLGADLLAFAHAGFEVVGVERDPLHAALATANLQAFGLAGEVRQGDALDFDFSTVEAAFADPSRRSGGSRVLSVDDGEPPLHALLRRVPANFPLLVKAAPGIPRSDLEKYNTAEAEFLSVQRELKECLLTFGGLRRPDRCLVELSTGDRLRGVPGEPTDIQPLGEYLCDPHPGVARADLLAALAEETGAWAYELGLAMLSADDLITHPFLTSRGILGHCAVDAKAIQVLLRGAGIGHLTIIKRGSNIDADALQRKLKSHGNESAILYLTKIDGKNIAILTEV